MSELFDRRIYRQTDYDRSRDHIKALGFLEYYHTIDASVCFKCLSGMILIAGKRVIGV